MNQASSEAFDASQTNLGTGMRAKSFILPLHKKRFVLLILA